jgi:hypothetical protein
LFKTKKVTVTQLTAKRVMSVDKVTDECWVDRWKKSFMYCKQQKQKYFTVDAPTAKAMTSVIEVTVMPTPA